jgi:ubiquinone/menaquinone biosynthesis C-methylase UbiE
VSYLPALRFRSLTRFYDPLVGATTREDTFKRRLIDQAGLKPGMRVLDLGAGTGTLAIMAKQREQALEVRGLDADSEMLDQAVEKAEEAGARITFQQGLADRLPYKDNSFDRVLSSLFFHHLDPATKRSTLGEVARVLAPGGELHVADWGRGQDPLMRALFLGVRVLDGFENTADNGAGRLPAMFAEAGLEGATEEDRLRTAFGTISLYSAVAG